MPDCTTCNDEGFITLASTPYGDDEQKCPDCNGTGRAKEDKSGAMYLCSCGTYIMPGDTVHTHTNAKKLTPPSQETKDKRKPGNTLDNRMHLAIGGDNRENDVERAIEVATHHASTVADKAVEKYRKQVQRDYRAGKFTDPFQLDEEELNHLRGES